MARRGAVAARPSLAGAALLRGAAVAAEARTVSALVFPAHRTLAARSAFRRAACGWTRPAERAAFAFVAARRAVAFEAAGSAVAAVSGAFETARRFFAAIARTFEAAGGTFAAVTTAFKAARR